MQSRPSRPQLKLVRLPLTQIGFPRGQNYKLPALQGARRSLTVFFCTSLLIHIIHVPTPETLIYRIYSVGGLSTLLCEGSNAEGFVKAWKPCSRLMRLLQSLYKTCIIFRLVMNLFLCGIENCSGRDPGGLYRQLCSEKNPPYIPQMTYNYPLQWCWIPTTEIAILSTRIMHCNPTLGSSHKLNRCCEKKKILISKLWSLGKTVYGITRDILWTMHLRERSWKCAWETTSFVSLK
jgi:hypothetical protein